MNMNFISARTPESSGKNTATARMPVEQILNSCGFNPRPVWYSGIAANHDDIGVVKLEALYRQVRDQVSREAANEFVRLVRDISSLALSGFVESFLNLASRNWQHDLQALSNAGLAPVDTRQSARTNEDVMCTAAASIGILSGNPIAEDRVTQRIKADFLSRHQLTDSHSSQHYEHWAV